MSWCRALVPLLKQATCATGTPVPSIACQAQPTDCAAPRSGGASRLGAPRASSEQQQQHCLLPLDELAFATNTAPPWCGPPAGLAGLAAAASREPQPRTQLASASASQQPSPSSSAAKHLSSVGPPSEQGGEQPNAAADKHHQQLATAVMLSLWPLQCHSFPAEAKQHLRRLLDNVLQGRAPGS